MEEQSIAFAFYKGDRLIGYRQDTVGTIGMHPKLYTYSKDQVNIVLNNINYNVKNKTGFGDALNIPVIIEAEEKIHNDLQNEKAFEVRVVKAPDYPTEFDVQKAKYVTVWEYPIAEVETWLQHPEEHDVIEIHYFSLDGLIQMQ